MITNAILSRYKNSSRENLDIFARQAAAAVPPGGRVLDAGAGDCMYKKFFAASDYESADFCQVDKPYGHITHLCELSAIPVEDGRYDLVYCTQVLEHIRVPQDVLKEFHRILKPTGELWLTAPLFYEEHEVPYDYFRYTRFGLTNLLEQGGFTVIRLDWLEGYYGTLAYQLLVAASSLPKHPWFYGGGVRGVIWAGGVLFARPLCAILSILFSHLDLKRKITFSGHCLNYKVVAIKRA